MKKRLMMLLFGAVLIAATLCIAAGNIITLRMSVAGSSTTVSAGETGYYPILDLNNVGGSGPVDVNNVSFMMNSLSNTNSGSTINFYYRQSSAEDASNPSANCWNVAKKVAIVTNVDTVSGNTEGYIYEIDLEPSRYLRLEVLTGTTDVAPEITLTFIGSK